MEIALDALLDEAYRRAALGYDEPVIHGGKLATVADAKTGEERRSQSGSTATVCSRCCSSSATATRWPTGSR